MSDDELNSYLTAATEILTVEYRNGVGARDRAVATMMADYGLPIEAATHYVNEAHDSYMEAYGFD
jgi:tetrahydromethanopterin S-methyltransferase subunit H